MVENIHRRVMRGDAHSAGALLDALSSPDDQLWPKQSWPTMRLDGPLAVGVAGRHGPIHYSVEAYEPGSSVLFRFVPPTGFVGRHKFTVTARDGGRVELCHILSGRPTGVMRLGWPIAVRWLHDALLEDLLDNAERALTGTVAQPRRWSRYVVAVRRVMRGRSPAATRRPPLTLTPRP